MFNLKKIYLIVIVFIIFFSFGIYTLQNPDIVKKVFTINAKATQQNLALSVKITGCEEETIILTGQQTSFNSTSDCNKLTIPQITGLLQNSEIKLRVYTSETPNDFIAPPSTQVEQVFNYINISINASFSGSATIFFNILQSDLGSTSPSDIRMYRYSSDIWNELPTSIINSASNPASFSAVTGRFSNFLIGKKVPGLPSVTSSLITGVPSPGPKITGRPVELKPEPKPTPKPSEEKPLAKIPQLIREAIKTPLEFIRYKLGYTMIYIVSALLLITALLFEAILNYIKKNKSKMRKRR